MSDEDRQKEMFNLQSLQHPDAFTHPVTRLQLFETHISRIILTGAYAYKIKKPVQLGFIDAGTLQRRRELCELELRLNRRFSPALYLDVVPVVRDESGQLHFDGSGAACDYAVRMRQFDATQELHVLLASHDVGEQEICQLAVWLAKFHHVAAVAYNDVEYGDVTQTNEIVLGNLRQLLELWGDEQSMPELSRLIAWTHDHLFRLEPLFESRKLEGAVRECHGDLHARNIVRWQGVLMPFDCLEFDPKLRWIDVMNDVAFLVMDLVGHQRPDLAHAFLSRYLESSGDYEGVPLLPFYAVYRASVRAMVDALGAQQLPVQSTEYLRRMRDRVRTALQFIDRPAPTLLIMHGASGSGKSWLSEQLVGLLPAVRIRSDVERKRLAGIDPDTVNAKDASEQPVGQGLYRSEFSHRTYARLLDGTEACLQGGVSTIVDAAFLDVVDRRLFFDLAARLNIQYLIVSCSAEPAVLAARIATRQSQHADASDANRAVLAKQLRAMQPLADYEQAYSVTVNTAHDAEVQAVMELLQLRAQRPRLQA
jgi:uncharacterized protein